jgi:hypothetical protein
MKITLGMGKLKIYTMDKNNESEKRQLSILAPSNFDIAQRMATALSKSTLIPPAFQNNLPNCLIALEMAHRMGASPMMVMQNLYIVHGKPAWSSQFVIAAVNSTGRFSPLRFAITGEGDAKQCVAWSVELATKEKLEGPPVSIDMAKKEGWFQKNGSKWQTMPELMLRYRAATFFGRLYAPEVLMGMREESEVIDVDAKVTNVTDIEKPVFKDVITESADIISRQESRHDVAIETRAAKKLKATKAKEPDSPLETTETPSPQSVIVSRLDLLKYHPDDLIKVAIENGWIGTEQDTFDKITKEQFQMFLDEWDVIPPVLDAKFRGTVEAA